MQLHKLRFIETLKYYLKFRLTFLKAGFTSGAVSDNRENAKTDNLCLIVEIIRNTNNKANNKILIFMFSIMFLFFIFSNFLFIIMCQNNKRNQRKSIKKN